MAEGQTPTGTITLPGVTQEPVQVTVVSSNPNFLVVPSPVTVPAGQREANFTATAVENTYLDFSQHLTITISAPDYTSSLVPFALSDNESRALIVTLPASVSEGGASGIGWVSIQGGALSRNGFDISVDSSDTSAILVQDAVEIPPGANSVDFDIFPQEDPDNESETVEIQATHPQLVLGAENMQAADND